MAQKCLQLMFTFAGNKQHQMENVEKKLKYIINALCIDFGVPLSD